MSRAAMAAPRSSVAASEPGFANDQLDPQIEAENVRGRGERVEADVVVVWVENPVQLAPARAHRSSHGTLAHLPSSMACSNCQARTRLTALVVVSSRVPCSAK